jgi:hypothetical protein
MRWAETSRERFWMFERVIPGISHTRPRLPASGVQSLMYGAELLCMAKVLAKAQGPVKSNI